MAGSATGMGAATGAASGAAMGTAIFPGIGTLIGAGIGAAAGGAAANKQEKDASRAESTSGARPKNRRLASFQNTLAQYREAKLAAQLNAAQSAFAWADSLRL